MVMRLIDAELSEPYTIFTYRYFLHAWPQLCYLAYDGDKPFGTVVCKMDVHREQRLRGYVAMLVVDKAYRGKGVGEAQGTAAARGKRMSQSKRLAARGSLYRSWLARWPEVASESTAYPAGGGGGGCRSPTPTAGSELAKLAIKEMVAGGCEEAVLEAEVSNWGALKLYQGLGFIREKRLHR